MRILRLILVGFGLILAILSGLMLIQRRQSPQDTLILYQVHIDRVDTYVMNSDGGNRGFRISINTIRRKRSKPARM